MREAPCQTWVSDFLNYAWEFPLACISILVLLKFTGCYVFDCTTLGPTVFFRALICLDKGPEPGGFKFSRALTPSSPGERNIVPTYQNHSICSKLLGVWSSCFGTFLSGNFSFRNFSSLISPYVCHHGNHTTVEHNSENSILDCFSSIPIWEKLSVDNILCVGHHNTPRSSIEGHIRSVTVEKLQNVILPKCGHRH